MLKKMWPDADEIAKRIPPAKVLRWLQAQKLHVLARDWFMIPGEADDHQWFGFLDRGGPGLVSVGCTTGRFHIEVLRPCGISGIISWSGFKKALKTRRLEHRMAALKADLRKAGVIND